MSRVVLPVIVTMFPVSASFENLGNTLAHTDTPLYRMDEAKVLFKFTISISTTSIA